MKKRDMTKILKYNYDGECGVIKLYKKMGRTCCDNILVTTKLEVSARKYGTIYVVVEELEYAEAFNSNDTDRAESCYYANNIDKKISDRLKLLAIMDSNWFLEVYSEKIDEGGI